MTVEDRRYLTDSVPPVRGRFRESPDSFRVEEIRIVPEPDGEGEHLHLWIEKTGIPTHEAVRRLARALGRPAGRFGVPGRKDAQSISRQAVSIDGVAPEDVDDLNLPGIRILDRALHRKKLRPGALRGNRFRIRIEGTEPGDAERAEEVLELLSERGVPNYFGLQRFGVRRNTHRLGRALCLDNAAEFVAELCGRPREHESPRFKEARAAADVHRYEEAGRTFPRSFVPERRVCFQLAEATEPGGRPSSDALKKAVRAVPRRFRRLYVDAFQSYLFNELLTERLEEDALGRIRAGDVAFLHRNGAAFLVEPEEADSVQARAKTLELSPSGPLFGRKLLEAEGETGRLERAVLERHEVSRSAFSRARGGRRPFRFPVREIEVEPEGEDLVISFRLPRGCYATSVMEELMKRRLS